MPPLIKHLWDCEFDEVASKITAESHAAFVDTLIDLITEAQIHQDDPSDIAAIIDHGITTGKNHRNDHGGDQ